MCVCVCWGRGGRGRRGGDAFCVCTIGAEQVTGAGGARQEANAVDLLLDLQALQVVELRVVALEPGVIAVRRGALEG